MFKTLKCNAFSNQFHQTATETHDDKATDKDSVQTAACVSCAGAYVCEGRRLWLLTVFFLSPYTPCFLRDEEVTFLREIEARQTKASIS